MQKNQAQSSLGFSPFGMPMPQRTFSTGYRYGFNGHEEDNEIYGKGNWCSFGDYGYDPRIVQRPSQDPLSYQYPWQSPYSVFNSNPILFKDIDGNKGTISIFIVHSNGKIELLSKKSVEGHVFRTVSRTTYPLSFLPDRFNTSAQVDFKQALDYKQKVYINAATADVTVGEKQVVGSVKAEASGPLAETRADWGARSADKGKGLIESFNIRKATGLETWLIDNFSQDEIGKLKDAFSSPSAAPLTEQNSGQQNIVVTESSIKTQLSFKQLVDAAYERGNSESKPQSVHCINCGGNYEFKSGSLSYDKSDTPATDTVKSHNE